ELRWLPMSITPSRGEVRDGVIDIGSLHEREEQTLCRVHHLIVASDRRATAALAGIDGAVGVRSRHHDRDFGRIGVAVLVDAWRAVAEHQEEVLSRRSPGKIE